MRTKNECAGYRIIDSIELLDSSLPGHEICLGVIGVDSYATWEYNDDSQFYWGHYDMKKKNAYANMYERAASYYRS